ncbi:MAG: hypothetical protein COB23_06040 [Methylophaga sp.]|nr:MAG: hypothetical protein COB23_06040 [Methylophaga sp.]
MAFIEVHEAEVLTNNTITEEEILKMFQSHLVNYYDDDSVNINSDHVKISSGLKGMWEWGVVEAEAKIRIQNGQLLLNAKGTVKLGKLAWFFCVLGFLTGVFMVFFLCAAVLNFSSKDNPIKYFKQAFKATAQEVNQISVSNNIPSTSTKELMDELEQLASMKDRGILTLNEFNLQKKQLLES